jgi:Flp pilus assembly pilin Flp
MNPLIPLYVTLSTFVQNRVERLSQLREDKGASLIEYAALLILVAAIVTALYAAGIINQLTTAVTNALSQIFGGTPT